MSIEKTRPPRAAGVIHSIVVPVYDEELVLPAFHARCSTVMRSIGEPYEIVYVDDGSHDGSARVVRELAAQDPHVRLVSLSRNFGHQVAITAGMDHALGETVTVIDADLQDPPEVIPRLVDEWRNGAAVVYAVRSERLGDSALKKKTAHLYYGVLNRLSEVQIPSDAGDFRLMGRAAVDQLRGLPEHHRYVRGLVAWLGGPSASVEYVRDPRAAGESKYPLRKMVLLGADGIVSFSVRPLRLMFWAGLWCAAGAILLAIVLVAMRLAGDIPVQGWTSLAVIVLFVGGLQIAGIGVLGEYVGRIYAETKGRPQYVLASDLMPEGTTGLVSGTRDDEVPLDVNG